MYEDLFIPFDKEQRERRNHLEATVSALPYLPQEFSVQSDSWGDVSVRIPWNDEARITVLTAFKEAGWDVPDGFFSERYGHYCWHLSRDVGGIWANVYIFMETGRDGSVCHLIEVGEVTKTEKIYEAVCND